MQFSDGKEVFYPARLGKINDSLASHLLFALKKEGVSLAVLAALFAKVSQQEIVDFIAENSEGKYHRRIWFFYEFLTENLLPLPPLERGGYIEALDNNSYFTLEVSKGKTPIRDRRSRVINNLTGNNQFCPLIQRTDKIKEYQKKDFQQLIDRIQANYTEDQILDATHYLCLKETKSSFAIERLTPDQKRMFKFVELLRRKMGKLTKELLIEIQNAIVDPRYHNNDYRSSQVYVGESVTFMDERVHYIAPKPGDIAQLMNVYLTMTDRLLQSASDPVLVAVVVSFAFVFLHPFDDGNGRLHRYLLHFVLSRMAFVPQGIVFPFSAQFYKNRLLYDQMLESVSKRILPLIKYKLSGHDGSMTVENETAEFYSFLDMTLIAELFYETVLKVIEDDFANELKFLAAYVKTRQEMRSVVDLPEVKARSLIMFVRQNGGILPKKRHNEFAELTDDEINDLTMIIRNHLLPFNHQ